MKRLTITVLLLSLAQGALAEDLLAVYRKAVERDPTFQAALATREAGQEAVPQARAGLLPNVSLSADLTRSWTNVRNATGTSGTNRGTTVTLVQPLFRKDRMVALEQARDQVRKADLDLEAARQDLVLRVAEAYFGVLSAQEGLVFAQAEKKAIARQLEQARERFEVGLVAVTDVHEAQARHDQARAAEITARTAVDNALEALRQIVGEAGPELADLRERLPLVPPEPSDPDAWGQRALEHNPLVRAARIDAEIARKEVARQRAGGYPALDLVGSLGVNRNDATATGDTDTRAIGLQLSMALYAGGQLASRTREAAQRFTAAQHALDARRREVVRQVRDAYRGIQTALSRVEALRATVRSALSALEATEAGFEAGTRTLVDVLNSQSELFRARRDYAQARYDYVLSTLRLLGAAGTLGEEDVARVNAWLAGRG